MHMEQLCNGPHLCHHEHENNTPVSEESDVTDWEGETVIVTDDEILPITSKIVLEIEGAPIKRMAKPPKPEILTCTLCQKGFINEVELENHNQVFHPPPDVNVSAPAVAAAAAWALSLPDSEDDDESEETIKYPIPIEADRTIRPVPMPVTSESLKAFDTSHDNDLHQTMESLTISRAASVLRSEMSYDEFETTYSVDDVDDLPTSEVAPLDHPGINLAVFILLNRWMAYCTDWALKFRSKAKYATPDHSEQDRVSQASSSSFVDARPASSIASSQVSGVRRPRPDDDDNDDEGNGHKPPKKPKKTSVSNIEHNKALACPFNKYDNLTFGVNSRNDKYHVCSTWSDVKTAYLKQHLVRTHCLPEFHCDRCGLDCKNARVLREHRRQDPPCKLQELDPQKIMPDIQDELGLRTRNTVKTDKASYWQKVFDTIFGPGEMKNRGIDPYYNGPLHEELDSFVRFSEVRLPDVIRTSRGRLGLDPDTFSETDRDLGLMIIQEARNAYMHRSATLQPHNLRENQQRHSAAASSAGGVDEAFNLGAEMKSPLQVTPHLASPQAAVHQDPTNQSWLHSVDQTASSPAGGLQPAFQTNVIRLPTRPAQQEETWSDAALGQPENQYNYTPQDFAAHDYSIISFADEAFLEPLEDPELYAASGIDPNELQRYQQGSAHPP